MQSLTYIMLASTHIVGLRETAEQINRTICNALPVENDKFLISEAIDFINGVQLSSEESQPNFKQKTNLPSSVRLQQGARVVLVTL